jgi:hypothetical protein
MKNVFRRDGSKRKASGRRKTHLQVERLDDRTVPSTFSVSSLADSGSGSLRQAILNANNSPGNDAITFSVTGAINLASVLPDLNTNIEIQGPGANLLTVRRDTGGNYRVFKVNSGATVTLTGLTISNGALAGDYNDGAGIENAGTLTLNHATVSGNYNNDQGGGIDNTCTLTLNDSTVSNNVSSSGSGIRNRNTGTLTLTNSTVSGNSGLDWSWGGGILNEGTATVTNSTISGNYVANSGGGILNYGTLTLTSSTVSGNLGDGGGGGILNPGTATVTNCTITGNSGAWLYGPAGGISNGGTLDLYNTVLSGNVMYDDLRQVGKTPDDFDGTINSLGHNLIGSGGTTYSGFDPTDLLNVDPLLGPLQYNGGPTFTHALLPGSPAIDAGDNTNAPVTDQRGVPRPQGLAPDIGAYELQSQLGTVSTTTSLASSVNPSAYGQTVSFTATVTPDPPGTGTPTGTVTFTDGTTILGTGTLNSSAIATFSTLALAMGTHSITAVYNGESTFRVSISTALTQTVNSVNMVTTTSLASSVNPSAYGQTVSFTATVTPNPPGAGTPTGTVTFKDGSTVLATATLNSSAVATFTTSALGAATHSITAVYNGNTYFGVSTSAALTQTVNQASTTTRLISSLNPSVRGQAVTFTAMVAAVAPGGGTPSGTVIFKDGNTTLGTGTLNDYGTATFTTSMLSVGNHSITAVYGGNANDKASTSTKLTQKVMGATRTARTLTLSLNPSVYGQSVSLTPTFTALSPETRTPTGTVTPRDGSTITGRQHVQLQPHSGFHDTIAAIRQLLDHRHLQRRTPMDKAGASARLTHKVHA